MRPDNAFRARLEALRADHRPRLAPELLPFPTPAQLDLLKAALMPAEVAAPAWRRWKARGLQLETVDEASGRMYPQLWTNREAAGIEAEDLPLLKGVYRQSLARNAVTLAGGLKTARLLDDAGIPVLFIKGAAMIAAAEGRLGLRRIVDVDLLVPETHAEFAAATLLAADYQSVYRPPQVGLIHAWTGRAPDGSETDLHWWAYKTAGDDTCMFETAHDATILGRTVMVPSATESLVLTVANAFGPGSRGGSPLRWITDSMLLLETHDIEWQAVIQRARRPGVALGLAAGLGFLASEFDAPVPVHVVSELQGRRSDWRERIAYWSTVHGLATRDRISHFERHRAWLNHNPTGAPRDFLGYMAVVEGSGTRRRLLRGWLRTALTQCLPPQAGREPH